jgi:hypothetical protein
LRRWTPRQMQVDPRTDLTRRGSAKCGAVQFVWFMVVTYAAWMDRGACERTFARGRHRQKSGWGTSSRSAWVRRCGPRRRGGRSERGCCRRRSSGPFGGEEDRRSPAKSR